MPRLTVGVAVVLACAGSAGAQDIRWRHDYAAARREATAAGKPLLLDFGTEACTWCRKLDATTLKVPAVVELLNAHFIPVKVDGEREAELVRQARVESYPTLLVVSPDGRIVGRHDGYADAAKLLPLLRQAVPAKPAATGVVQAGAVVRPTAADHLAQARADHDAGRYLACIERCDRLVAAYPAGPEATEARRLSAAITADPKKWERVTAQLRADLDVLSKNLDAAMKR